MKILVAVVVVLLLLASLAIAWSYFYDNRMEDILADGVSFAGNATYKNMRVEKINNKEKQISLILTKQDDTIITYNCTYSSNGFSAVNINSDDGTFSAILRLTKFDPNELHQVLLTTTSPEKTSNELTRVL